MHNERQMIERKNMEKTEKDKYRMLWVQYNKPQSMFQQLVGGRRQQSFSEEMFKVKPEDATVTLDPGLGWCI